MFFLDFPNVEALRNTLGRDCLAFMPEIILCGAIVLLLLERLIGLRGHLGLDALILTVLALAWSYRQWLPHMSGSQPIFGGLIAYDNFTIYLRMFLFGFTALVIWLSMLTGIPDREDAADFYCLLLGATVGMSVMASANHLLMVYIGVEMASLPSYALAGFLKGKRHSSEASLKYVVYGGGASGIMLYGISLIAGKFGTAYIPDLAAPVAGTGTTVFGLMGNDPIVVLGTLLILVGISFKLAAVPFQFWCPDVFEGAAAEVAAFLSVASKGAALALLGRLALMLSSHSDAMGTPALVRYLVPTLAVLAVITATFGNLAAYPQTNLKRLLAYSTIAHAGYMMMGLAPLTGEGASAVLFYLIAYLFMNLGAFAIIAFLRNLTGSEDLKDFKGLIHRAPVLVITLAIFLLSLLGLPPLAGFAAKFQIFQVLFSAGRDYANLHQPGLAAVMYGTLIIGGINTVFSAFYYMRVLRVMILDRSPEMVEGKVEPLPVRPATAFYATLLAAMIFVVGVAWNPIAEASDRAGQWLSPPSSGSNETVRTSPTPMP
jgi:NADH-quinone oxidoreductase subunit N